MEKSAKPANIRLICKFGSVFLAFAPMLLKGLGYFVRCAFTATRATAPHAPSALLEPSIQRVLKSKNKSGRRSKKGTFARVHDAADLQGCRPFRVGNKKEYGNLISRDYRSGWVIDMLKADPDGADKVFVDLGCNLGDDAVVWSALWGTQRDAFANYCYALKEYLQRSQVTEFTQMKLLRKCRTSWQRPTRRNTSVIPSSGNPRVFCVEPLPANFQIIQSCARKVFLGDEMFKVIHAAVSDRIGTANIPDVAVGTQNAQVKGRRRNSSDAQVHVFTVDSLATEFDWQRVDVLTIDTEGYDPAVLAGATNTLAKVRYLLFEVHQNLRSTPWGNTTVLSQVEFLGRYGFDCYFAGQDTVQRLSGCWNQSIEARLAPVGWSNIVCAKKGDEWHTVLQRYDIGL